MVVAPYSDGSRIALPPSLFGSWVRLDSLARPVRRCVVAQLRRSGRWPEMRGRGRPVLYVAPSGALVLVRRSVNGLTLRALHRATTSEMLDFLSMGLGIPRGWWISSRPALSSTRVQKPIQG